MKLLLILLTTLFADANAQYAEGNYAEAAVQYEQILAELPSTSMANLPSDYAVVYYNLGNAYFKQGELAQAILAYERALRIKPSFKDAKHNLQFAQSRIIDNIEDIKQIKQTQLIKALRSPAGIITRFLSSGKSRIESSSL